MLHCNKIAILCGLPTDNNNKNNRRINQKKKKGNNKTEVQPLKKHLEMAAACWENRRAEKKAKFKDDLTSRKVNDSKMES